MTTPAPGSTKTIVLIHGLWMTPLSWEHWVTNLSDAGYNVIAPAWPHLDGPADQLRKDPSAMGSLGVKEIADHYEAIIKGLDEAPIILGHSFGGLITQILVDRGLGVAGVGIDSGPGKGVLALPPSALKVAGYALRKPSNRKGTVALTHEQFHYAFTNTMSLSDSQDAYERYCVPGPGRPLFQAAFAAFAPHSPVKVNWANSNRAPVLLIGGEKDHTVPAAVTKTMHRLYGKSSATTDIKVFAGRPHFICGAPGWEEVMDYAVQWANTQIAADAVTK